MLSRVAKFSPDFAPPNNYHLACRHATPQSRLKKKLSSLWVRACYTYHLASAISTRGEASVRRWIALRADGPGFGSTGHQTKPRFKSRNPFNPRRHSLTLPQKDFFLKYPLCGKPPSPLQGERGARGERGGASAPARRARCGVLR